MLVSRKLVLLDKISVEMRQLQLRWARLLKHKSRVQKVSKWR